MPFEKYAYHHYNDLDLSTKYRFAEIEMSAAKNAIRTIYNLGNMNISSQVARVLYNRLVPWELDNEENRARWDDVFNALQFIKPRKDEMIIYLMSHNHSYATIQKITGSSPNTIAKYRIKAPWLYPLIPFWNLEMLDAWRDVAPYLNLFNDPLTHTKL